MNKNKIRNLLWEIADTERLTGYCSECYRQIPQISQIFFFIKNLRIREFFCNDKNFCFAMNLRIVSRRRFFVTQIPQIHTDFLFIKN